jgi:hypothetical protein
MAHSDQGIVRDKRAEEQPRDKERAQTVHKAEQQGSASREATRDPAVDEAGKTPGSGMTPGESGSARTG